MAKVKQNASLSFAGIVLATLPLFLLFALLVSPATFGGNLSVGEVSSTDCTLALDNPATQPLEDSFLDSDRPLQSHLFLGARRPLSQTSLRPQRGRLVYGLNGRDGAIVKCTGVGPIKNVSMSYRHRVGFPSPQSYRVPKEYYVFTLERILC